MQATFEPSAVDVIRGDETELAQIAHIGELLPFTAGVGAVALLLGPKGERLPLPEPMYRVLRDAVDILGRGDAIIVGSLHQMLTTTEAADLLGVSRQYLTRLIDRGDLNREMVGRHRRLRLGDVLAYKAKRSVDRREALAEMSALDIELGAYE